MHVSTMAGKFNVIDMSVSGDGEWKKWNNARHTPPSPIHNARHAPLAMEQC